MSVLYYAGGSQWWCKRCQTTVRATADGHGKCLCTESPSPWEPVCRKCLQFYRNRRGGKRGLKRLKLPFSGETVWRFTLFGWTAEWAYGSCTTDVSHISMEKPKREILDYDEWLHRKEEKERRIRESVPEEVQLAALEDLSKRGA